LALDDEGHQAGLGVVLREWGRIGVTGFGGPPAHIALLRRLCVDREGWLDAAEFEDAIATCNLLPGPASTELAIFCAWRVRGRLGALVGGLAFILPGLIVILVLSALFLAGAPPVWVRGVGAGAGGAVAAVAVAAGWALLTPSWKRASARDGAGVASRDAAEGSSGASVGSAGASGSSAGSSAGSAGGSAGSAGGSAAASGAEGAGKRGRAARLRWAVYLLAGGAASATIGPWLVLVLLGCGGFELALRHRRDHAVAPALVLPFLAPALAPLFPAAVGAGLLASVAWVAFKVGALSFGGGFVIIPLMQADAVGRHWMTGGQFLNAVALGQITPGPVVQTVSAVGYAAAGLPGGLLAAFVAFTPSFVFVLGGGRYFDRLRGNPLAQSFLDGAGPAAIGAIFGSAILLGRELSVGWQFGVLGGAAVLLLVLRRGVVLTLLTAAATGLIIALAGGPLPT
jgi:chromate transporter